MKLGTIAGVTLKVNLLFLILCMVYVYLGMLISIVVIIASLLLHELAHIMVAFSIGIKIEEIEILPFGGQAKMDDFTGLQPEREIYTALAGPVLSLSLAGFFYFLPHLHTDVSAMLFMKVNLLLGLFNLLPALPLDGGRVLRAVLSKRSGFKNATRQAAAAGKLLAVGLVGTGIYYSLTDVSGANLVFLGLFLYWAARNEAKLLNYAFMRYLVNKKGLLARNGYLDSQQIVSRSDTLIKELLSLSVPNRYLLVVVVDEREQVRTIKGEAELIECLLEKGPGSRLEDC